MLDLRRPMDKAAQTHTRYVAALCVYGVNNHPAGWNRIRRPDRPSRRTRQSFGNGALIRDPHRLWSFTHSN